MPQSTGKISARRGQRWNLHGSASGIVWSMDDVLLRVPESNAADRGRGQAASAIVIWALLIAICAGIYSLMRAMGDADMAPVAAAPIALAVVMTLVIFTKNMIVFRRQIRRFQLEIREGAEALARGDLRRARDTFWSWSEHARLPTLAAHARHNLAWTLLRQGELDHALAVWMDNEARRPRSLAAAGLSRLSAIDIALCHALSGHVEESEQWVTVSEQRTGPLAILSLTPTNTLVRAVLDCRAGRHEDAARLLDERWLECEVVATGEMLRPLRVVRALAITARGPRHAGVADGLVAPLRPAYSGEYSFLGGAWPEMASFLAAHHLSR